MLKGLIHIIGYWQNSLATLYCQKQTKMCVLSQKKSPQILTTTACAPDQYLPRSEFDPIGFGQ